VSITVQAVNPSDTTQGGGTSAASATIKLLDPAKDEDGDGMTNAQEKTAGTNPLDSTSAFKIVSISRPANTNSAIITWNSVPGKTYDVEATTDLKNTAFTAIATNIPAANSPATTTSYTDPTIVGVKFYRIRVH
jgi:hypothetical protein